MIENLVLNAELAKPPVGQIDLWLSAQPPSLDPAVVFERHPWSIEESGACFIVRDGDKQALAYVYFQNEHGRR